MTPYEQLKQVIQAANPEIMELKFGCEVLWNYEHQIGGVRSRGGVCRFTRTKRGTVIYHHVYSGIDKTKDSSFISVVFERQQTARKIHPHDVKILGRPIRLADVLLATKKNKLSLPDGWEIGDLLVYLWGAWNAKDDNLDHQSEETKKFLIDLLTN